MATEQPEPDHPGADASWRHFVKAMEQEKRPPHASGRRPITGSVVENLKGIAIVLGILVGAGVVGGLLAYFRGPKETLAERQMREMERDRNERNRTQRELQYLNDSDKRFEDRKRKELEEAAERERERNE